MCCVIGKQESYLKTIIVKLALESALKCYNCDMNNPQFMDLLCHLLRFILRETTKINRTLKVCLTSKILLLL